MISLYLGDSASRASPGSWRYRVASHLLVADRPVGALYPFQVDTQEAAERQPPFVLKSDTVTATRGLTGWVARARREVTCCQIGEQGYRLLIGGVGAFAIRADGSAIIFEGSGKGAADEKLVVEALLGPALSMAMAAQGTFCLHASAQRVEGRAVAFLGDSGAGKSMLAAYLASQGQGWQRIADDVLPVTLEKDELVALPHFPQLKLPPDQQIGPDVPEWLPLEAVYLLDVPPGAGSPAVTPLDSRAAAAILIRHTLATSLFDKRLLSAHMDFCAGAAAGVPVRRLIYPHSMDTLPGMAVLLAADIGETTAS